MRNTGTIKTKGERRKPRIVESNEEQCSRRAKIARSWKVFARGRKDDAIGPTTRTSVAFELGPPLNMATDGPND